MHIEANADNLSTAISSHLDMQDIDFKGSVTAMSRRNSVRFEEEARGDGNGEFFF